MNGLNRLNRLNRLNGLNGLNGLKPVPPACDATNRVYSIERRVWTVWRLMERTRTLSTKPQREGSEQSSDHMSLL